MCLIIAVQQIAIMTIVQLPIVVSDPAFLLFIHLQQTFPNTSFWLCHHDGDQVFDPSYL